MPVGDDYSNFMILPPALQVSLPEGYLLETIYRYLGKSLKINDDFDILSLVGNNMVGRVNACRAGEALQPKAWIPSVDALMRSPSSRATLGNLIEKTSLGTGLSGVIPKALASQGGGHSALIFANAIIKVDTDEYPGLCVIEFLSMQMCRAAGVDVPNATLAEDGRSLAVDRFDVNEDGTPMAFEDFCSLSGRGRAGKYSGSCEGVALLLSVNSSHPSADLRELYRVMLMNTLLRNGDAHLKNFGVIYTSGADVRLAPACDIVCTQTFIPDDLPALPIRTNEALLWPSYEALTSFGRDVCELEEEDMAHILDVSITGIQSVLDNQLPNLEHRYQDTVIGAAIRRFQVIACESIQAISKERSARQEGTQEEAQNANASLSVLH